MTLLGGAVALLLSLIILRPAHAQVGRRPLRRGDGRRRSGAPTGHLQRSCSSRGTQRLRASAAESPRPRRGEHTQGGQVRHASRTAPAVPRIDRARGLPHLPVEGGLPDQAGGLVGDRAGTRLSHRPRGGRARSAPGPAPPGTRRRSEGR
jgi:hypothetical protein